jgi:hypothetical protein
VREGRLAGRGSRVDVSAVLEEDARGRQTAPPNGDVQGRLKDPPLAQVRIGALLEQASETVVSLQARMDAERFYDGGTLPQHQGCNASTDPAALIHATLIGKSLAPTG